MCVPVIILYSLECCGVRKGGESEELEAEDAEEEAEGGKPQS